MRRFTNRDSAAHHRKAMGVLGSPHRHLETVTAEALMYAWEHWPRLREMDNPAGYLCRGRYRRRHRPGVDRYLE